MAFRRDVYSFIDKVNQFIAEQRGKQSAMEMTLREYQLIIDQLKEQNQALHDRLMSRNLPELKTFSLPDGTEIGPYEYRPEEDEALAGEVVEMEDKSGTTE